MLEAGFKEAVLDALKSPEKPHLRGLNVTAYTDENSEVTRFSTYARVKVDDQTLIISQQHMPDNELRKTLCVTYFDLETSLSPTTIVMVAEDTGERYSRTGERIGLIMPPETAKEHMVELIDLLNETLPMGQ